MAGGTGWVNCRISGSSSNWPGWLPTTGTRVRTNSPSASSVTDATPRPLRAARNCTGLGSGGNNVCKPPVLLATTWPESVSKAAVSAPACSRKRFTCPAGAWLSPSSKAARRVFSSKSACRLSSTLRPSSSPPSSALSTRTSNHESMLFTANCMDTAYTSVPGSTAITASMASKRNLSRAPKMPSLNSRRKRPSWTITIASKARAATPLIPSSHG